jgi:YidC/Oxa1 family membrane protein insertase
MTMDPRVRRILITLIVLAAAVAIIALTLTSGRSQPATQPATPTNGATPAVAPPPGDEQSAQSPATADTDADAPAQEPPSADEDDLAITDEAAAADAHASTVDLTALMARAPGVDAINDYKAGSLGSFEPALHRFKVDLTTRGAGVERIIFSDIWEHALHRRQAQDHIEAVQAGDPNPPPMPPDTARLKLVEQDEIRWTENGTPSPLPVLAARAVIINGTSVHLFDYNTIDGETIPVWAETAPGTFETVVSNSAGEDILRIDRKWTLRQDSYELQLDQTVTNLTDEPLELAWQQYGPPQLALDRAPYVDPRRFRIGYLLSVQQDPQRLAEVIADSDMMYWISNVVKRHTEAAELEQAWRANPELKTAAAMAEYNELHRFWPNASSRAEQLELSWFASTNRYFAMAVHPLYIGTGPVDRSLADTVEEISHQLWWSKYSNNNQYISTLLTSPQRTLGPGEQSDFSVSVYAGPMERSILYERQPHKTLNLGGLIFYQISSFCGFCTFQWLAHLLIWFLGAVHAVTFDWAVAIIILVFTVRLILHPITKRAQVSMHRTMKRMAKFKPEMDKLQKKYANDKKKLQVEQVRLMREHGVNPLGCLGFVPMLLQMPIWIALYAMLYFAYELRHEPAFWGVFQMFWDWTFLADLSQADHFLGEFSQPVHLFGFFMITGINVLPLLMGLVFFVQQKYMTPPTAATMSKEQQQQQKIMRVMMIVLFPIMLYSAPSGLTLYIMTSSILGIIESKMIRQHAEHLEEMAELDKDGGEGPGAPPWGDRGKKPRKPRDPRGRAYAQMLERMREGKKQPSKSFKRRRKD